MRTERKYDGCEILARYKSLLLVEHEDTAICWIENTETGAEFRLKGRHVRGPHSYWERDHFQAHPEDMEKLLGGEVLMLSLFDGREHFTQRLPYLTE